MPTTRDGERATTHVVSRVPVARELDTVEGTIGRLAERSYDTVESIYVLDEVGRLCGAVPLVEVLRSPTGVTLGELADPNSPRVHPDYDQEHVAAQALLERPVAIAFFVPAIVYLADAIGTQTEAIVVRGLSISRLSLRTLLAGEIRTGMLIGATLGALSLPLVVVLFGDVRLGVSVAVAVTVAGTIATTTGLLLPWLLQRLGSDPALGSGPVATIIQDVLSILIYFAIATQIMT